MKTLGDLRQTIQEIWEFVVPPIINLGIILALLFFASTDPRFPELTLPTSAEIGKTTLMSTLEPFKLQPVIPILALLVFLFLLNFIDRMIKTIGALVPIDFSWYRNELYMQSHAFFDYWRLFPDVKDPSQLISKIESRMEEERAKDSRNAKVITAYEKEFDRIYSKATFIKFVIVMLLYCLLHDFFSKADYFHTSFILFGVIGSGLVLIYYFTYAAKNLDQKTNFFIYKARELELYNGQKEREEIKEGETEKFNDWLDIYRPNEKGKWWYLSLSIHRFNWMKYLANYRIPKKRFSRVKRQ